MFDPSVHTLAAYQSAVEEFVSRHGFTPGDAVRTPTGLHPAVLVEAQRLDAWDVWLFTHKPPCP